MFHNDDNSSRIGLSDYGQKNDYHDDKTDLIINKSRSPTVFEF